MKDVAALLNDIVDAGIIADYAVFGAVAQMRYTEAVATLDADILVSLPADTGLDILGPLYEFCSQRGFTPEGEAIRVGDWPVQFIPTFNALTEEALANAEVGEVEGVPLRVIRADYLAIIALSTGRAKDFARIVALVESGSLELESAARIAENHSLQSQWIAFREKFLES